VFGDPKQCMHEKANNITRHRKSGTGPILL